MPNRPESGTVPTPGMARLERAIAAVADALAELITTEPEAWERLLREEAELVAASMAYWKTFGAPAVPEVTIGHLTLEALHARHPLVFGEPIGTA